MTRPRILLAAALALTGLGRAQSDTRRVELDAKLAKQLVAFARSASSQKAHTLSRQVATLVVEHYDADSSGGRRLLGQRRVRGEWQRDGKPRYAGLCPRVWAYLERDLSQPVLAPVAAWFDDNVPPELRGDPHLLAARGNG